MSSQRPSVDVFIEPKKRCVINRVDVKTTKSFGNVVMVDVKIVDIGQVGINIVDIVQVEMKIGDIIWVDVKNIPFVCVAFQL